MLRIKIVFLCICFFLLAGCATVLEVHYDQDGKVKKVVGKGKQKTTVDGICTMDNKPESPFKDMVDIDINALKAGL